MNIIESISPRQSAVDLPQYLTDKQVAELTGIALPTLRNKRSRDEGIPYIKLGRSVRYSLADVLEYMESRRVVPGGDA